jgi:hypothetical protein
MARSSIALFLASASLIAGLSGCGGEGSEEKRPSPADSAKPSMGAPQGTHKQDDGEGGEGGEGGEN